MIHVEKEIFEEKDDVLFINEWSDKHEIIAGFTTKKGGVSKGVYESSNYSFVVGDFAENVIENRQNLAKKIETSYEQWIFAQQKHTTNVREVAQEDCGAGTDDFDSGIKNCDALFTKEPQVILATFHADCTPIYLYDKSKGYIGLIHAGWQGSVAGITMNFMNIWKEKGISPKNVEVVIGPSAQFVAYEVGREVAEQVLSLELDDARDALVQLDETRFKLDVPYLNYLQLIDAGVPAEQIIISNYCTISDKELFYSYRRDGKTGRMLAFIMKK